MPTNDEEPYSTIFASLKHPIRRRILRMLSQKPLSFSEMTDILGVSNSFLIYHLENLGELVSKTEDGKYKLSSFGEAANATMNKVEDISTIAPHNSKMLKTNWFRGRNPVAALGIVCILLIASLGGTIAYYTITINNKQSKLDSANETISQLNATIAEQNDAIGQLNTTISNLQNQIASLTSQVSSMKSLLSATPTTVSELVNDTSAWVNKTVVLEGNLAGSVIVPVGINLPIFYELRSNGQTIALTFNASVNLTSFYSNQYCVCVSTYFSILNLTVYSVSSQRIYFLNSSITVKIYGVVKAYKSTELIYGVVKQGKPILAFPLLPEVTYYVEAEEVEIA